MPVTAERRVLLAPEAIRGAAARAGSANVGVINLSLQFTNNFNNLQGGEDPDGWPDQWQLAVNAAGRRGVSVVGIAGNVRAPGGPRNDRCQFATGTELFPGAAHGAVTVGGTDIDNHLSQVAEFHGCMSNQGQWLDIAADANEIITSWFPNGDHGGNTPFGFINDGGGTSLAAPQVAAAISALTSSNPAATAYTTGVGAALPALRAENRVLGTLRQFAVAGLNVGVGFLDLRAAFEDGTVRLGGIDRLETSVRIAREVFPGDSTPSALDQWLPTAVVLARGRGLTEDDGFADSLAPSGFAAVRDAPVLLVEEDDIDRFGTLDSPIRNEIDRLLGCASRTIYVVGGTAAVSNDILTAFNDCNRYTIRRIDGATRYHTAAALADEIMAARSGNIEVTLVAGDRFPDAMTMSTWAYANRAPMLMTPAPTATNPNPALHAETLDFLQRHASRIQQVHIAGGTAAVSQQAEDQAETAVGSSRVLRWDGTDRYDTAQVAAQPSTLYSNPTGAVVATGMNWPDGIAGGSLGNVGREYDGCTSTKLAGRRCGWPLLLTRSGANVVLEDDAAQAVGFWGSIFRAYLLGREGAVGFRAQEDLDGLLAPRRP
ncbi:MAG: cell wall-binding repeat-containing protein [Actinobacteria bacterium]|nr:cell wall-binding repeat-containing protein [Actinomycetota bacterium]